MENNLELNIDQLILNGFSSKDSYRIKDSISNELNSLFSERGIPNSLQATQYSENLNVENLRIQANSRPEKIGVQVAQSIYSSFRNG